MSEEGLTLDDPGGRARVRVNALHLESLDRIEGKPDVVLLAVKSYDTGPMLKKVKPLIKENTLVVSCQNGLNEEIIAAFVGRKATLGCVISLGAGLEGPGRVRQFRREGRLTIGQLDGGTEKARELTPLMSAIAHTDVTGNLPGHRWAKLALNCMGNPLLALSGYTVRELHQDPTARQAIIRVVAELVRAAEAHGVEVAPIAGLSPGLWKQAVRIRLPEVDQALDVMGRKLGEQRSSMVHDLNAGRPTEVEFLNGYVVSKAREGGLDAPCNEAAVALVKKLSKGEIEPDPVHLESILAKSRERYNDT
jgi:2-dehydropantoate 2-reductase